LESAQKTESFYMCFKLFLRLFFSVKFLSLVPLRNMWKKWIWWKHIFYWPSMGLFALLWHFMSLGLDSHSPNSFLTRFIFFTYSWGGPGIKIWPKKKAQKQFETHIERLSFLCWLQIWCLFEVKSGLFWPKTIEYQSKMSKIRSQK
jgi:hypothetical protein